MAIGPVQLVVLGFHEPEFKGEVIEELERLRESDTIKVIDAIGVYKHADGELEVKRFTSLSPEDAEEFGSAVGALVGLGVSGLEGAVAGAELGAEAAGDGVDVFEGEEWDVLGEIPPNTAAALLLIEHHWAVPLRDAVVRAGGFGVADGFIRPMDLVGVGLIAADEAEKLEAARASG